MIELEDAPHLEDVDDAVPVLDADDYSRVFWRHLKANVPCLVSDATSTWRCSREWVDEKNASLDVAAMLERYSSCEVGVLERCDDACSSATTTFAEYVEYWSHHPRAGVKYLKDWHLKRQRPADDFYTVPRCFASDWLNEHSLDTSADDFMFVYMGPEGSFTPLHADVYSSFSWSANVTGQKEWLLFPPGEETAFLDRSGNLPASLIPADRLNSVRHLRFVQNAGDAVFVPSGWYHTVRNVRDTLSINHNWMNACNVFIIWRELVANLLAVQKEIAEFEREEGWPEHCQLMLRASHGMNCADFISILKHVCEKRIAALDGGAPVTFGGWTFGKRHLLYDLETLLRLFREIADEKTCKGFVDCDELAEIANDIERVICDDYR